MQAVISSKLHIKKQFANVIAEIYGVVKLPSGTAFVLRFQSLLIKKVPMLFVSKLFRVSLMLALPLSLLAQKEAPIVLNNPSFEDVPSLSHTPIGWYDCGQVRTSPPDVQPGFWGVTTAPYNGSSYLGMVVRDNETWESVGQRLSRPMENNSCYELGMYIVKRRNT